jgi:hypothetical protein
MIKECQFGQKVVEILRKLGCETWQEVSLYGYAQAIDIVAKFNNQYIGIELKTTLNDTVLEQINTYKDYFHYSIACIYTDKNKHCRPSNVKLFYANQNNLSIMYFNPEQVLNRLDYYSVGCISDFRFICNGTYNLTTKFNNPSEDITKYLYQDQIDLIPGSVSYDTKNKMTPFKRSCNLIIDLLNSDSSIKTAKDIWDKLFSSLHWANLNSFKSCLYNKKDIGAINKINELLNKNNL